MTRGLTRSPCRAQTRLLENPVGSPRPRLGESVWARDEGLSGWPSQGGLSCPCRMSSSGSPFRCQQEASPGCGQGGRGPYSHCPTTSLGRTAPPPRRRIELHLILSDKRTHETCGAGWRQEVACHPRPALCRGPASWGPVLSDAGGLGGSLCGMGLAGVGVGAGLLASCPLASPGPAPGKRLCPPPPAL